MAFSNSVTTGNAKIDELISAETTKIKGFPLRQSVQVTTINNASQKPNSKLTLPTTRTKTRETTVTAITETASADDTMFRIPAGYSRNNYTEQVTKSQTQVLSTTTSPQ
jgi:hypothetical protein